MNFRFAPLDWLVIAFYVGALILAGILFSRRRSGDSRDYFLAGGHVPAWLAAISVLATTQSAATFLGAPDYGFRGDFTYLGASLGSLIAAFLVTRYLMPRFYAQGVTTVYELLAVRFGMLATKSAGAMFLVGRTLSGGARLYLSAIALSMMIFLDIDFGHVVLSAALLVAAAFLMTFHGGLRSIVWIDLLQFSVYAGAAVALLLLLRSQVAMTLPEIIDKLGPDKLRLFNLSTRFDQPFSLAAIVTGHALLAVANFGLDQDTTQRLLACRDAKSGSRGMLLSILAGLPVVAILIAIGSLLFLVTQQPDLQFHGAKVTVFLHFILTRAPPGLRGLAAIGIMATAVGTTMSALNAMSSVLIEDFYRPWRPGKAESHYVLAGRFGMALTGLGTLAMAVLSLAWQRFSDKPLLEFVLSVMNFAYAGLLGVFFAAIFTRRGSTASVIAALAGGFLTILLLQRTGLAFPWQLCLGFAAAFFICIAVPGKKCT